MFPTVAQWHAISFALQNDFLYKMVWLMFVQCHCVELFDWFVVFSCVFCYIYFCVGSEWIGWIPLLDSKNPDIHRYSSIQTQTNYYINDIPGPSEENQNPLVHPCTDM